MKKKIVFICNSVSLAHPVRVTLLANMLDPEKYEVVIYRSKDYDNILPATKIPVYPAHSIPTDIFTDRLLNVQPIFDTETIRCYAEEDLRIIDHEKPDLIIGDFRLTLQVTARQRHVPYMNLTGAVWDPLFHIFFESPPVNQAKFLPNWLKGLFMNYAPRLAFSGMNRPLNIFREQNGFRPFTNDPRYLYTDADYNVYCDLPVFFPQLISNVTRRFIGPVLWAPNMPDPDLKSLKNNGKYTVYINLGSSGNPYLLERLCTRLAPEDINLIVATGRALTPMVLINRPNTIVMPYLASDKMSAQADVVICNGGMPTACTALVNGAYCMGMISNLDQIMGMRLIEKSGAGACFRNQESDIPRIVDAIRNRPYLSKDCHEKIVQNYILYNPENIFPAWICEILADH